MLMIGIYNHEPGVVSVFPVLVQLSVVEQDLLWSSQVSEIEILSHGPAAKMSMMAYKTKRENEAKPQTNYIKGKKSQWDHSPTCFEQSLNSAVISLQSCW